MANKSHSIMYYFNNTDSATHISNVVGNVGANLMLVKDACQEMIDICNNEMTDIDDDSRTLFIKAMTGCKNKNLNFLLATLTAYYTGNSMHLHKKYNKYK